MATLPPDPYAPDPIRTPDGTPLQDDRPPALPGPENPQAPSIDRGDVDNGADEIPFRSDNTTSA